MANADCSESITVMTKHMMDVVTVTHQLSAGATGLRVCLSSDRRDLVGLLPLRSNSALGAYGIREDWR